MIVFAVVGMNGERLSKVSIDTQSTKLKYARGNERFFFYRERSEAIAMMDVIKTACGEIHRIEEIKI